MRTWASSCWSSAVRSSEAAPSASASSSVARIASWGSYPPGVRVRLAAQLAQALGIGPRELLLVAQGGEVVGGQQLHHLLLAIGQCLLRPAGHVKVLGGPIALGQRVVGHVAGEALAETELCRAGQPRRPSRHDQ